MSTLTIELEDELMGLLSEIEQPVERAARELIVLELYRRGSISAGKGAELLGLREDEFLRQASVAGVPYFRMTSDDWDVERRRSEAL